MADDLTSNTPPSTGSPPPHPPKSTTAGLTTPPTLDSWPPNETDPIPQSSSTPPPTLLEQAAVDAYNQAFEGQGTPAEKIRDQDTAQVAQDVPDNDCVICPACAWQFRAIPVNVQRRLADLSANETEAAFKLGGICADLNKELASIKESVREIVAERDLLRQAANTRDAQNAGLADLLEARDAEITHLRRRIDTLVGSEQGWVQQIDVLQKTNAAYVENDALQTRTRREAERKYDRLRQQTFADQEEIECLRVAVTDALIKYARANERVILLERQINHPHALPRPVHHDEQGPIYKDDLDEDALRDGFLRRKRPPTGRPIPLGGQNSGTSRSWMDERDPHQAFARAAREQPKKHPIREEFDRRKLADAFNHLDPPRDSGKPPMDADNIVGGPNEPELAKERLADFAAFEQRAAEILNTPEKPALDGFGEPVGRNQPIEDGVAGASGEAGPHVSIPEDPDSPATTYGVSDETMNKPAGDTDER
jgi:hypothetical protein